MKAFVFACAFLALNAVVTRGNAVRPDMENCKQCVEESKVDEAKIIKIRKDHIFPDDESLQQYFFCVLSKEGIVDAEGKLNRELALSMSPTKEDRDKAASAFDKCLDQKGTPVQKVYLMTKCYVGLRPDVEFI